MKEMQEEPKMTSTDLLRELLEEVRESNRGLTIIYHELHGLRLDVQTVEMHLSHISSNTDPAAQQ